MSSDLLRQVASAHEPDRDATSLNSACQWTQTLTPSTHFHQRLLGWLHGIGLLSCGQSVTSNVRFHFQAFHASVTSTRRKSNYVPAPKTDAEPREGRKNDDEGCSAPVPRHYGYARAWQIAALLQLRVEAMRLPAIGFELPLQAVEQAFRSSMQGRESLWVCDSRISFERRTCGPPSVS